MKTINLVISNNSRDTFIPTFSQNFEAETMPKAVGMALHEAWYKLTAQYDCPSVEINGIRLTDAQVKKIHKKDFLTFRINFPMLRESILPSIAILQSDDRIDYIRHTDINKIFENQVKFSSQEIALQGKEVIKKTRFVTSLIKDEVKSSVWSPKEIALFEAKQKLAKEKRIEAKKQIA